MSNLEFITLETHYDRTGAASRQHSLALSDDWPGLLETIGVIPHYDRWRPATARDRDRLVQFLEDLNYDD